MKVWLYNYNTHSITKVTTHLRVCPALGRETLARDPGQLRVAVQLGVDLLLVIRDRLLVRCGPGGGMQGPGEGKRAPREAAECVRAHEDQ
jgi:hypothetical protein